MFRPARSYTPSPAQVRALDALATYKLLNPDQMRRLGVARHTTDVRDALRDLVRLKWVGQTEAALIGGVKRLPALYWIRSEGVEGAASVGVQAIGSRRRLGTETEIEHRMAIVEAHMALRAWPAVTVDWFVSDFDPTVSGLRKATAIGTFVPDAIAQVRPADGIPRLLVVEVERGGMAQNLTKFRRKLPLLYQVCLDGWVEDHFGAERGARFLILFQSQAMQARALSTWEQTARPVWESFFTKGLDGLGGDFGRGWTRPDGVVTSLF